MTDQEYVYATLAVMVAAFLWQVLTKRFDPFAPVWLFLVGLRPGLRDPGDHAPRVGAGRPRDRPGRRRPTSGRSGRSSGSWRSTTSGPARLVAGGPAAAAGGVVDAAVVAGLSPLLIVWGLFCALAGDRAGDDRGPSRPRQSLLRSFPFVMMVGGDPADRHRPDPARAAAGVPGGRDWSWRRRTS